MPNIYEKLQDCKAELQALSLPKTGENKFAHYSYWELSDYLPTVISLFKQHKLFSYFSFGLELATLTIINSEQPEESISLTSPMAAADLKGCHAIQNMGAVETYQRRYLYMAALDISEPDALDGTQGKPDKQQGQPPKPPQNAPQLPPVAPPATKPKPHDTAHQIAIALIKRFGENQASEMLFPITGYKSTKEIPDKELKRVLDLISGFEEIPCN
jgi:hypothetical protein